MPKQVIIYIAILLLSCTKPHDDTDRLLIGRWKGANWTFSINNLNGEPAPFNVLKKQDSLFIKLLPGIDLNYKIVAVSTTTLTVTDRSKQEVYTRF